MIRLYSATAEIEMIGIRFCANTFMEMFKLEEWQIILFINFEIDVCFNRNFGDIKLHNIAMDKVTR